MLDSTPRRRNQGRVLAAIVLALFALGWITDRAHSAFERHAWCDEHKQVEHHDADVAGCAHADRGTASDEDCGPSVHPLAGDPDGHAACCVLLARGDDAVAVPNPRVELAWIQLGEVLGRAPPAHRESVAPIPLVLLAPKQSPPAI